MGIMEGQPGGLRARRTRTRKCPFHARSRVHPGYPVGVHSSVGVEEWLRRKGDVADLCARRARTLRRCSFHARSGVSHIAFQLSTQAWKSKWNSEGWVVLMWHEE